MRGIAWDRTLALGCAIIAIADAAILGTAAWNLRGSAHARLELTEREISMPASRESDDSGISLTLLHTGQPPPCLRRAAWSRRYTLPPVEYPWLDRAKMRDLGIAVDLDPADPAATEHYGWMAPRRMYVAFELDGPAFREWLAERERRVARLRRQVEEGAKLSLELEDAEALLEIDRVMRSRLFPVDAGPDADALERWYAEAGRHLVLPGVVGVTLSRTEGGPALLVGTIAIPEMPDIHVPVEWYAPVRKLLPPATVGDEDRHAPFSTPASWPAPAPPRYRAVVAFGRRFEPWLVKVSATDATAARAAVARDGP